MDQLYSYPASSRSNSNKRAGSAVEPSLIYNLRRYVTKGLWVEGHTLVHGHIFPLSFCELIKFIEIYPPTVDRPFVEPRRAHNSAIIREGY